MKKKSIYIVVLLTIIAYHISLTIFNNRNSIAIAETSSQELNNSTILTINMAEIPQIPWDVKKAAVHVAETFSAAVHGSLAPYYFNEHKEPSNQNVLLEDYYCQALTCIAKLKEGKFFHNNREVTAYDVEFSLIKQLIAEPDDNYAEAILDDIEGINNINLKNITFSDIKNIKYPTGLVTGIKVIDKYQIEFKLKRENKFFFARISDGKLPIVPIEELQDDLINWKKYPIGFGKYKVDKADLQKHEYYLSKVSAKENIPKYIKLIFSSDKQGDIKLLLGGPERGNEEYEHRLVFSNPYSNGGFLFNYTTELGKNEHFRKALSLALDRKSIARAAYFNELFAEDQLIPNAAGFKEYHIDLPIQEQNIELAKYYLNKVPAHLWQNKTFEIPTYWEDVKSIYSLPYITEIEKQLAVLGIKVKFLNSDDRFEKFIEGDERIFAFTGFAFANKDPHKLFAYFRKGSYFQNEHPNDPAYEELYQKAVNNLDPLNKEPTKILGKYFMQNNFMIVLFIQRMSLSYDPKVVISLGRQYNGTRFAIWEIKMRE